jgi:hypothetical protein
MAGRYRYWCGECRYRTPWSTEWQGAGRQLRHYALHHPDVEPGGRVEVRRTAHSGAGCVALVGALFLILLFASTCRFQPTSAPAPSCAHGEIHA